MNVTQFPELIVEMLGINNHDKVDDRVVLAMADSFRGQLLEEMFASSGGVTGDFIKEFSVSDIKVDDFGRTYIKLPCDVCPIANNGAFRFVGPEEETNWIPLKPGSIATNNGTEVGLLAGKTGYYQQGDRLLFRYFPVPAPNKILLKLVPNLIWLFENAKDTELIGNATVEAKLIKMCFDALVPKAQIPEDKDNSNKTTP